jgi:hypothetical protein
MWDWITELGTSIWDAIPTSESLFGTDIWNWGGDAAGTYDTSGIGPVADGATYGNMLEGNIGPVADGGDYSQLLNSGSGSSSVTTPSLNTSDTDKSWMDSFKEGVTSPEAIVAGASILGKSYLDNKAQKDSKEKQEDTQEHESTEKQKDRDLQLQMLKEKMAAEAGAAGQAAAEQRKLARFNAMIRMAEGQRDNALLRGQSSSSALQKLAELASNPLRR